MIQPDPEVVELIALGRVGLGAANAEGGAAREEEEDVRPL